ncbi:MAG: CpaF family protein, partial [Alphaproteobacteria bacterium]
MFGKKPIHSNLPVPSAANKLQHAQGTSVDTINIDEKKLFAYTARNEEKHAQARAKAEAHFSDSKLETAEYLKAKKQLTDAMLDRLDFGALRSLPDEAKKQRVRDIAGQILYHDIQIPLTALQVDLLKDQAVDDLLGFGPIEVLMADPDVADIMINGHDQIYVEKKGKILLTDITFGSEKHLINVIQKIVSIVGRRIDESSPMVDARMPDGSRFNAIIPPLALDGSLVSIRKFRKQKMTLQEYVGFGSMSQQMHDFLSICGQIRINIIISGGTGSGKTTLLNAL